MSGTHKNLDDTMLVSRSQHQAYITLSLIREFLPLVRSDATLPQKIQHRLSHEKNFGSRDRRRYRELIYTAIRYLPWLEKKLKISDNEAISMLAWLCAETPATKDFKKGIALSIPDMPEYPADTLTLKQKASVLGCSEKELLPSWFSQFCPAASGESEILHTRAPLWIRLQARHPEVFFQEFNANGWQLTESEILPGAYRVSIDANITASRAYQEGLFEIQDLGSQLIIGKLNEIHSGTWLDACAGAGGKTLQLARLLFDIGYVDAYDIRPGALSELNKRAQRAGIHNINIKTVLTEKDSYEHILIDAPCSGLGTIRRAPQLKWLHSPESLAKAAARQKQILAQMAPRLKSGGTLTYATCSLARVENEEVVEDFLSRHSDYQVLVPPHYILPSENNTDGFFSATLQRHMA